MSPQRLPNKCFLFFLSTPVVAPTNSHLDSSLQLPLPGFLAVLTKYCQLDPHKAQVWQVILILKSTMITENFLGIFQYETTLSYHICNKHDKGEGEREETRDGGGKKKRERRMDGEERVRGGTQTFFEHYPKCFTFIKLFNDHRFLTR